MYCAYLYCAQCFQSGPTTATCGTDAGQPPMEIGAMAARTVVAAAGVALAAVKGQ